MTAARFPLRASPLAVSCALLSIACQTRVDDPLQPELWVFPDQELVLMQQTHGELRAVEPATGQLRWKYRPAPLPRQPFGVWPAPLVVCPPLISAAGTVVLRYMRDLRVLSLASGEMRWKKSFRDYRYCPAVTPDSGIVLVTQWGEALEKLDVNGNRVWVFDLRFAGIAVGAPQAVPSSGDVLIQTVAHLVSVNPDGKRGWSLPIPRPRDPGR